MAAPGGASTGADLIDWQADPHLIAFPVAPTPIRDIRMPQTAICSDLSLDTPSRLVIETDGNHQDVVADSRKDPLTRYAGFLPRFLSTGTQPGESRRPREEHGS